MRTTSLRVQTFYPALIRRDFIDITPGREDIRHPCCIIAAGGTSADLGRRQRRKLGEKASIDRICHLLQPHFRSILPENFFIVFLQENVLYRLCCNGARDPPACTLLRPAHKANFHRVMHSSSLKDHPPNSRLALIVICCTGIALLICLTPYDYQWTIYFSTHKAERFADFMNRSVFDGAALPGAGDLVYPPLLITLIFYILSWSWKYESSIAGLRISYLSCLIPPSFRFRPDECLFLRPSLCPYHQTGRGPGQTRFGISRENALYRMVSGWSAFFHPGFVQRKFPERPHRHRIDLHYLRLCPAGIPGRKKALDRGDGSRVLHPFHCGHGDRQDDVGLTLAHGHHLYPFQRMDADPYYLFLGSQNSRATGIFPAIRETATTLVLSLNCNSASFCC